MNGPPAINAETARRLASPRTQIGFEAPGRPLSLPSAQCRGTKPELRDQHASTAIDHTAPCAAITLAVSASIVGWICKDGLPSPACEFDDVLPRTRRRRQPHDNGVRRGFAANILP